ncbi:MAG TPA: hypothetical protein VMT76_16860 [Puia sp.]|nr:hypothetical protein [Puia sp.]
MQKTETDKNCLQKFKPSFTSVLYSAKADVIGKHLSGLLIIKKMPDSSIRIVFSSEMGFTFFDFEFRNDGSFEVHNITKQMDKKSVIRTLKKDFELILMENLKNKLSYSFKDSAFVYTAFPQTKGVYYYITDLNCTQLIKMQRASKSKIAVEAVMQNYINGIPDTIGFSHNIKISNFDIGLKRIER